MVISERMESLRNYEIVEFHETIAMNFAFETDLYNNKKKIVGREKQKERKNIY